MLCKGSFVNEAAQLLTCNQLNTLQDTVFWAEYVRKNYSLEINDMLVICFYPLSAIIHFHHFYLLVAEWIQCWFQIPACQVPGKGSVCRMSFVLFDKSNHWYNLRNCIFIFIYIFYLSTLINWHWSSRLFIYCFVFVVMIIYFRLFLGSSYVTIIMSFNWSCGRLWSA